MSDPVDPSPSKPLIDSYIYASPLPPSFLQSEDQEASAEGEEREKDAWIMGIDEAGRGRKWSDLG